MCMLDRPDARRNDRRRWCERTLYRLLFDVLVTVAILLGGVPTLLAFGCHAATRRALRLVNHGHVAQELTHRNVVRTRNLLEHLGHAFVDTLLHLIFEDLEHMLHSTREVHVFNREFTCVT